MVREAEFADHGIMRREILIGQNKDRDGESDSAEGEQDDFAPAGHADLDSRRRRDVQ